MLVGRELERRRIDELLEGARGGKSGALVLLGEPGVGKSVLLSYSRDAPGLRSLTARPVESESEVPFSGLSELLKPVLDRMDAIPARQTEALAGALALGPAVSTDRFASYAATLSLLAAAAEDAPLLVAVDDAQWLDRASAEALLFTARRLGAEGIALLVAVRTGHGSVFEGAGLEEAELEGLSLKECAELLTGSGLQVAPAVTDRLHNATAGNPLAILELATLLSEDQLTGIDPLGDPLPAGASVERAFARRVAGLPEESRTALLVAAAGDSQDMGPIANALKSLDLGAWALEPAESEGLVIVGDGRIVFRHPVLRSVVYQQADAALRRRVHAALAGAHDESSDRRAWHLAAAALEPDEEVAAGLEKAALNARDRSSYAAATRTLERAAGLSPRTQDRVRRLVDAADLALTAGLTSRVEELLSSALPHADDARVRNRIQHLRARAEMWRGNPTRARSLLLEQAAITETTDPSAAFAALFDATLASQMMAETSLAIETAERAQKLGRHVGEPEVLAATVLLGQALLLNGQLETARRTLDPIQEIIMEIGTTPEVLWLRMIQLNNLFLLEEFEAARSLGESLTAAARESSALGVLPMVLAFRSQLEFWCGEWSAAYADATECTGIAQTIGHENMLAFGLVCRSQVEAGLGREQDCRSHLGSALEIVEQLHPEPVVTTLAEAYLGRLEMSLGQFEEAIRPLSHAAQLVEVQGMRHPATVQWAPDLCESYVRTHRHREAARLSDDFDGEAHAMGHRWAIAASARCRGLVAADSDFEEHFADALERHEQTTAPFELARTQLCFGERLRRAKRKTEAREHLGAALKVFEGLGAIRWADRARAELRASGASPAIRTRPKSQELTPQELQVALTVAKGATNKEAAAALFLSPKTVESHLGRVYRKLGVRSRSELTYHLRS